MHFFEPPLCRGRKRPRASETAGSLRSALPAAGELCLLRAAGTVFLLTSRNSGRARVMVLVLPPEVINLYNPSWLRQRGFLQ